MRALIPYRDHVYQKMRTSLLVMLLLGVFVLLSGCSTLGFYQQAVAGQMRLLGARQNVVELLTDPALDLQLRVQLEVASDALDFAQRQVGLGADGGYSSYVELDAASVVWNLVVAKPDSVQARHWCFPVAGCVAYRGYFSEARAQKHAARFSKQGFDVYVGGVAAYSTLGWFNDPLLSSFIQWPRPALGELLFHELAHGELYLPGATEFNESFATFVATEALRQWLGDGSAQPLRDHLDRREEAARFNNLLLQLRNSLAFDFAQAANGAAALRFRELRYAQAAACYQRERKRFSDDRFDAYFAAPPNMARLALVSAYNRWVDAFAGLFDAHGARGQDWPAFYAAARSLSELPRTARAAQLRLLAVRGRHLKQQVESAGDDKDTGQIQCEALAHHGADGHFAGGKDNNVGWGRNR
jgi:predicted aminopeptidase